SISAHRGARRGPLDERRSTGPRRLPDASRDPPHPPRPARHRILPRPVGRSRIDHARGGRHHPPLSEEGSVLEEQDIRKIVIAEQSVTGEIADRFSGGQLVLKPGRTGTQEKTVPIETFFRKLVGVRDRLRVLEQRINAHPKLDDADRLQLGEYITRAYGSLTT